MIHMARPLSLLLAAPHFFGSLTTIRPDDGATSEGGGGASPPSAAAPAAAAEGAAAAASAPEPVSPAPAARTAAQESGSEAPQPVRGRIGVLSFHFTDEDGRRSEDRPELVLSFNSAVVSGISQTFCALGEFVAHSVLPSMVHAARYDRGPVRGQEPEAGPQPNAQELAEQAAAGWVRTHVGPAVAQAAAKLRAEALIESDPEKAKRAEELEKRLAAFLAEAPERLHGVASIP